jgi:putative membrane protein
MSRWRAVPARAVASFARAGPLLLTAALLLGILTACVLVASIGGAILQALPALPAAIAVHVAQLAATAMAWRALFHPPRPSFGLMLRARWIRESLNGLLPLVGVGGGVLAATSLARSTGLPFRGVAAGSVVDLLVESVSQVPILLLGIGLFAAASQASLPTLDTRLLVPAVLLAVLLVVALRLPASRAAMARLLRRAGLAERLAGLRDNLRTVDAGRAALARGVAWHLLAWSLGALEVWCILAVLGTPVSLAEAFAIESLGMAARSLGFVLPAGLGAQEAGLTVVAAALGVPLEAAIALALLKRLREVVMGVPGLIVWQREERRTLATGRAVPAGPPGVAGGG